MGVRSHRATRRLFALALFLLLAVAGNWLATAHEAPRPPSGAYHVLAPCSVRGGCPLSAPGPQAK